MPWSPLSWHLGSFACTLKGTLLWFKSQETLQQRESEKCSHSQGLFTPQSVSQSKCLLNFKLNGHLKGDSSPPTVKKMKLLASLMLSLGSRFEDCMEFCPIYASISRTAQLACPEKQAHVLLSSFNFDLVNTGIIESLTSKMLDCGMIWENSTETCILLLLLSHVSCVQLCVTP